MMGTASPLNRLWVDNPAKYVAPHGAVFFPNFDNLQGKTQVSRRLVDGQSTAVIVTLGQSNSANYLGYGETPYVASPLVHNFNYLNGGMYLAADPLLGCPGEYGNYGARLGDLLISRGRFQRVIIAPIAINASLAEHWKDGGIFNQNLRVVLRRLLAAGLTPTFICYQQGESDNRIGTSSASITASLRSMVTTIRAEGVNAPVFIALTALWPGYSNDAQIRAGQAAAVDHSLGIYQGPDTDTLDAATYRTGGVHFNAAGAQAFADLTEQVLAAYLAG
ncbi:MAG: hypothetical protein J0H17_08165 [Rhizobiales bacterium]|nr:hypothetical protein [Hyphomicrobiales bacterium]